MEAIIQYFRDADLKNRTVPETGIHDVLHDGLQNVMKSEPKFRKYFSPVPKSAQSENRRPQENQITVSSSPETGNWRSHGKLTPISTLLYIWKQSSK